MPLTNGLRKQIEDEMNLFVAHKTITPRPNLGKSKLKQFLPSQKWNQNSFLNLGNSQKQFSVPRKALNKSVSTRPNLGNFKPKNQKQNSFFFSSQLGKV